MYYFCTINAFFLSFCVMPKRKYLYICVCVYVLTFFVPLLSPIIMVNSAVIRFDYRFGYGQSSSTAMADTTSALFSLTD